MIDEAYLLIPPASELAVHYDHLEFKHFVKFEYLLSWPLQMLLLKDVLLLIAKSYLYHIKVVTICVLT